MMKRLKKTRRCSGPFALAIAAAFGGVGAAQAAPGDPLGSLIPVTLTTGHTVSKASVARDASGNFVVVWADLTANVILGRRFAADGVPLDQGFQVNADASGIQFLAPDVAMDRSGDFVVTWLAQSPLRRNTRSKVFAKQYAADGAPMGAEFAVETKTGNAIDDGAPAVAMDAAGDFVVAWERAHIAIRRNVVGIGYGGGTIELSERSVVAQRFQSDGTPQGATLLAATRPSALINVVPIGIPVVGPALGTFTDFAIGSSVDVAMDHSGDFALTWGGEVRSGSYAAFFVPILVPLPDVSSVYARQYDATGHALNAQAIRVDSSVSVSPVDASPVRGAPVIAMDDAGDLVVAWTERSRYQRALSLDLVQAQRIDAKGKPQGDQIAVATDAFYNDKQQVAVAYGADGSFVLAWDSYPLTGGQSARAQLFSSSGAPLGAYADLPDFGGVAVATDPTGNFVITALPASDNVDAEASICAALFAGQ